MMRSLCAASPGTRSSAAATGRSRLTDGREALEVYRRFVAEVSLVLLDLTMPYMNGEEVLRELKIIRPSVKVLLSSGFNEIEAVRRFAGKGLAGFLQKPYSAAVLAETIKRIIADEP